MFSSKQDKKPKRPISAINKRQDKKSANFKINHDSENKEENNVEELTDKFFEVKNNVKNLIGKENADCLFKELTDVNFDEVAIKYYKNDDNNIINYENDEKFKKLKMNIKEYINIIDKVCLIKNKE